MPRQTLCFQRPGMTLFAARRARCGPKRRRQAHANSVPLHGACLNARGVSMATCHNEMMKQRSESMALSARCFCFQDVAVKQGLLTLRDERRMLRGAFADSVPPCSLHWRSSSRQSQCHMFTAHVCRVDPAVRLLPQWSRRRAWEGAANR